MTQCGSASPSLFRIFIDDLAKELRVALDQEEEGEEACRMDPAKLVADDVILIAIDEETMQTLLDTCTKWAERNMVE